MGNETIKVLLTGSTGFVGAHLLRGLLSSGIYNVAILIRPDSNTWRIDKLLDEVTIIKGTLQNIDLCNNEIHFFAPDIVINLAWSGVVGSDRNNFEQIYNISNILKLIEICGSCGCSLFVGFGSQAEYGISNNATSEVSETRPKTLYGSAKLSAFHNCRVYAELHKMRFIWGRIYDPYGPMDNNCWLIPSIINKCLNNETVLVTKAEQKWDFIYIDDLISAILSLINNKCISGLYNIGSGKVLKLKAIINYIVQECGNKNEVSFGDIEYRSDQIMHLEAVINKISKDTGWSPIVGIYEGINKTIEWHRGK